MKRILPWALILVAAIAVGLIIARQRVHQMPSWYPHRITDPVARRAAANSAEHSLIDAFNAASAAQAAETRARLAAAARENEKSPAQADAGRKPITLHFSEQELNAFFDKWEREFGWKEKAGKTIQDPAIAVESTELILAATVATREFNTVLSLHFEPRLADGKLSMNLARVTAGTLPLPRAYYSRYERKLETAVNAKLPTWREQADISPAGSANRAAVQAGMGELLLHALHDEPAEPVIFLPNLAPGHSGSLPVKITDINLDNKTLTLTMMPMDRTEREALLAHLQEARTLESGATASDKDQSTH